MAKKSKDTIYAEFLADLKALNPQVEAILGDEKVSAKLKESVLARADYSQSMDELKAARQEMENYLAQERQKIEGWQKWYGETSKTFATTAEELQRYKEEFGDLSATDQRQVARSQGLTVEQFEQKLNDEIQKRESAYLKFAEDLTDIKLEHKERFKEKLDTSAVYDIAAKQGVSLDMAYKAYIADRVEDLRKTEVAGQIRLAKEEGYKEALSKHNLPGVSNDPNLSHVLDVKDAPRDSDSRVRAALAAFGKK